MGIGFFEGGGDENSRKLIVVHKFVNILKTTETGELHDM